MPIMALAALQGTTLKVVRFNLGCIEKAEVAGIFAFKSIEL